MGIGKARGFLYALARLLGDVNAVRKGPGAVARRVAQRAAGKATGRLFRRLRVRVFQRGTKPDAKQPHGRDPGPQNTPS